MKPAMKARVATQEQITLIRELEILMMVLMMVNVLVVICVHWSEVASQLRIRVSKARIYPGAGYGISFRSSQIKVILFLTDPFILSSPFKSPVPTDPKSRLLSSHQVTIPWKNRILREA